jgi:hypothetical protein
MKTITLLAAALLVGCGTDAPESAPPSPTPVDAAVLTAHRLGGSSLSEMRLLATPDGRDTLSLAVSCALPAGASITAIASDGTPYTFAGRAGLAPAWMQRTPTAGERRHIVACVRARQAGTIRT